MILYSKCIARDDCKTEHEWFHFIKVNSLISQGFGIKVAKFSRKMPSSIVCLRDTNIGVHKQV